MKGNTLSQTGLSSLCFLLLSSVLIFYSNTGNCQAACGSNGQMTQPPANLFCGSDHLVDYIPQSSDEVKTLDIVVNVMQKEYPNDPENFSNTPEHIAAIKSFLFSHLSDEVNKHPFRSLQVNAYDGNEYPNDPYVQNGKIQPRIIEINFIPDNTGWNNDNSNCGNYNFINHKGLGDKTDVALMVYLVEGIIVGSPPNLWSVGGCGEDNYLILHGYYKSYFTNNQNGDPYTSHWLFLRELAAHELGHSVGSLPHTFYESNGVCLTTAGCGVDDVIPCPTACDGCYPYDDLPLVPQCSNNLMSYASVRRYFSPKQLASFHRNLTRTDFSRFVNHISNSPAGDLYINSNQTWSIDRFVYGDVYIQPGATLTVECVVYMPPKSRIIVKQGARLIVDCGKLTTNRMPINSTQQYADGDYWTGIEVWGNSIVEQTTDMRNPTYNQQLTDPGIVLLSDSEISNARPGIMTIQRGAYSWEDVKKHNFGGLIYATNTDFVNNLRSVAFLNYDFTNYSAFIDCMFTDTPEGSSCVSMWETDGITFKNCTFSDVTRVGIISIDASISVSGSTFENVHHGVENKSSLPMNSNLFVGPEDIGLPKNTFENCEVGVYITATGLAKIYGNDFIGGSRGIYANGECEYDIKSNDFLSCQIGIQNSLTLNSGNNRARCNLFDKNDVGIHYLGDNSGARMLYNEFTFDASGTSFNVRLEHTADLLNYYPGSIRNPQMNENGLNGDLTAGNLFGATPTIFRRHILAPSNSTTSIFNYHASKRTFNERVYPICGMNPEIECIPNSPPNQNFEYTSYQNIEHNSGYCGTIPPAPSPCQDVTCYAPIKSAYDQAVISYQNSPTQTNLTNLAIARTRKYEVLRDLLIELQRVRDYSTYLTVINAEQNDFGRRAKLWYYIDMKDWVGAQQYINGFTINNANDQAFFDVQTINITRRSQGYDYVLSANNINSLKAIASSTLPDRAYARAILVQMIDTLYEPELIQDIDPRSIEESEIHSEQLVRVWPNPTAGLINVDLSELWKSNEQITVTINSITGSELLQSAINKPQVEIDIATYQRDFICSK